MGVLAERSARVRPELPFWQEPNQTIETITLKELMLPESDAEGRKPQELNNSQRRNLSLEWDFTEF